MGQRGVRKRNVLKPVVVPASTAHSEAVADFTAWVADRHRPLLDFAQLVAGDASTAEDLLQTALARAYLKWSRLSNENASLWRRAWKRRERSTGSVPEAGTVDNRRNNRATE